MRGFATSLPGDTYLHLVLGWFQAKACSTAAVKRLQQLNRRTLDFLAARVFYYYSYSHEITDSLADIRG